MLPNEHWLQLTRPKAPIFQYQPMALAVDGVCTIHASRLYVYLTWCICIGGGETITDCLSVYHDRNQITSNPTGSGERVQMRVRFRLVILFLCCFNFAPISLTVGHDRLVRKWMNLIVCPFHAMGPIPGCAGIF